MHARIIAGRDESAVFFGADRERDVGCGCPDARHVTSEIRSVLEIIRQRQRLPMWAIDDDGGYRFAGDDEVHAHANVAPPLKTSGVTRICALLTIPL